MSNGLEKIVHEQDDGRGEFRIPGKSKMTYVLREPRVMDVNHTWTEPDLRGNGLALRVFEAMAEYARKNGYKVIPSCPYVAARFEERPELADLLA